MTRGRWRVKSWWYTGRLLFTSSPKCSIWRSLHSDTMSSNTCLLCWSDHFSNCAINNHYISHYISNFTANTSYCSYTYPSVDKAPSFLIHLQQACNDVCLSSTDKSQHTYHVNMTILLMVVLRFLQPLPSYWLHCWSAESKHSWSASCLSCFWQTSSSNWLNSCE